jgi:Zn finger protein HypA/HybF involved in hydrogenase expression
MHEISIAKSLIDWFPGNVLKMGLRKLNRINASTERATGILPVPLSAFYASKSESIAKNVKLNLAEVPVTGYFRME